MSKKLSQDMTIAMAVAILAYDKAHAYGRPRSEQTEAHTNLVKLAEAIRKVVT